MLVIFIYMYVYTVFMYTSLELSTYSQNTLKKHKIRVTQYYTLLFSMFLTQECGSVP